MLFLGLALNFSKELITLIVALNPVMVETAFLCTDNKAFVLIVP